MTDGRLAYAEEITRFFRQVVGVVLVSWRRILRAGLVSGALTLLGAEIAACLVTGSFPPADRSASGCGGARPRHRL